MKPAKEQNVKEPPAKEKEKAKSQKGRTRDGRRKENVVARYFRQTWAELKKTNWPTRREAVRLTGIVLAVTVAMSAMLGVIDWLFSLLFSFLIKSSG
ncbi:MAG: preprotein translocase subunit SecE [Anaerolineae bacterium]|nr:preprotein translocase subunit SecE [Anaerolineae bacterium]